MATADPATELPTISSEAEPKARPDMPDPLMTLDGKRVDVPSASVRPGQTLADLLYQYQYFNRSVVSQELDLSPAQRLVLELAYVEGPTQVEIARRLLITRRRQGSHPAWTRPFGHKPQAGHATLGLRELGYIDGPHGKAFALEKRQRVRPVLHAGTHAFKVDHASCSGQRRSKLRVLWSRRFRTRPRSECETALADRRKSNLSPASR